ncbi:MAG: hypothetical protein COV91_05440 [Candidatus Taylorbacteria bacterium CG11_big_fil_rev_8_21_14_0_20_46_11]|uniref:Response regulatory domain-containing protein n=1 Tax=Candidatus Taylorbacteria bacterium CG11_big_fil_rev_8_21_14_0_20_46_11 TaxID=1975025 RepID=A0A2H0KAD0_9BACT|nr:MAG: hypothetical protein COV91_05440 [Candidatus Taylorbacteria bacterium CG11_big_fil_rev_8_21_14_0_20_46_11]
MNKLTVLVVEDEQAILDLYKILLEQWGFRVIPVQGVKEALAVLGSRNVDILLTDEKLDDGNGLDVAQASKKQNPTRPIVVCSGTVAFGSELQKLANATLMKPFVAGALEEAFRAQSLLCREIVSETSGITLGTIYSFLEWVDKTVYLGDGNARGLRFYTEYANIIRRLNATLPNDLKVPPEVVTQLKDDVVITGESLKIFGEAEALFRRFEAEKETE